MLNLEACREDRFLCSEFVYYLLKECGIANLNKAPNLVRPQDLLNIEGRVVFKGNLKNNLESLPALKYAEVG